jgi:hypothetical protein
MRGVVFAGFVAVRVLRGKVQSKYKVKAAATASG